MTIIDKKPTLLLQPIHNSSADILKAFANGQSLSTDQMHFLEWHQKELSDPTFDPVLHYYLKARSKRQKVVNASFLLPHEEMNFEAIELLKKRLRAMLQNTRDHAVITLTQKQFLQFREITIQQLIFWHGNQFLTGAPFYPGGIPPVIYFQWGNFFGIVKYVVLPGEKSQKANTLIYFEDMQDRDIDQCIHDYTIRLKNDINLQNELLYEENLTETETESLIKAPKLQLSPYYLIHSI